MKKYIFTALLILFLIEIFSLKPLKNKPLTTREQKGIHFLSGVTHVHSTYSDDAGGTVEEIAAAANTAGLDFVVLTDHNDSRARKAGYDKRVDNTDIFVEMEASSTPGHTIVFFSHTPYKDLADLAVTFKSDDLLFGRKVDSDFFSIVAHPSNLKMKWAGEDYFIRDGFEVFNLDSIWQRNLVDSPTQFLISSFFYFFNPYLAYSRMIKTYNPDLQMWDRLNLKTPGRFATFGHDSHSILKFSDTLFLRWPSYLNDFRIASNIVFLKEAPNSDFETRKRQIYKAIRQGQLAIVFNLFHSFENIWHVQCGDKVFMSGDRVTEKNCQHSIDIPSNLKTPVRVKLYKDGNLEQEWTHSANAAKSYEYPVSGKGFYRVEVWLKQKSLLSLFVNREVPYLFYNPIYVN